MRRWPLILLALAVLLVGGRFIYGLASHPDDKTLIQQALAEAIQASKEGRPGGVVDKLAENFRINDQRVGAGAIADIVKKSHPEVTIKDSDPIVSGDTAQITSDVEVKGDFMGSPQSFTFKDAAIQFKKESAMDWLIFPTTKWHLSAAKVAPESLPQLPGF